MIRVEFVTIVLDGMPWLTHHLPAFNRLSTDQYDWRWSLATGVSANVKDTSWMRNQLPRLSGDGTTEYLDQVAAQHSRVRVFHRKMWPGKTAQINACLDGLKAPAIIVQIDSDEVWQTEDLERMIELFRINPDIMRMQFFCRYHLGFNIVASAIGYYGNRGTEWMRAWRMTDDAERFITHEPPNFSGNRGRMMTRDETISHMIQFDHFAYATRPQLEMKEKIYGYAGAVAGWERLQRNKDWPTRLKPFMPWVDDGAIADLLVR